MKTIGLIGGMSPQSTLKYYQQINNITRKLLGGHHSAKLVLASVDFEDIVFAMVQDTWDNAEQMMLRSCLTLERCAVDCIALCCNTLHKVMDRVVAKLQVPFIHILDPVIAMLKRNGINKVALLGSKPTVKHTFHQDYLLKHITNIEIVTPSLAVSEKINSIILDELCHGVVLAESVEFLSSVVEFFAKSSVQAVILACTELEMAFAKLNSRIPLLDTTSLHAQFLVNYANCR